MKKQALLSLTVAMIVGVSMYAQPAHAQLGGIVDTVITVTEHIGITADTGNASVEADAHAEVESSAQAAANTPSPKPAQKTETSSDKNKKTSTTSSQEAIVIDGAEIRVGGLVTLGSLDSALSVKTDAQLKAFAESVAVHDEHVTEISLGAGEVALTYTTPVSLFGLLTIDLSKEASVQVSNDGEVEVQVMLPWWSKLVKDELTQSSDIQAAVEQSISASIADVDVETQLSTQLQAEILEDLHQAMKADAQAQAALTASSTAQF